MAQWSGKKRRVTGLSLLSKFLGTVMSPLGPVWSIFNAAIYILKKITISGSVKITDQNAGLGVMMAFHPVSNDGQRSGHIAPQKERSKFRTTPDFRSFPLLLKLL